METPTNKPFLQTGGARIGRSYWGSMNASIPFARLTVTEEVITLKAFGKTYTFPKADISDIWLNSGLISDGVQIEHRIKEYPPYVVFWTPNLDESRSQLHRLGYRTR